MPIDLAKLENPRSRGEKIIARCPACAEAGADKSGEHLAIFPDGRFACIAFPGDDGTAHEHRRRIYQLAGTVPLSDSADSPPLAVSARRHEAESPPRLPEDFHRITREARSALYSCPQKQEAVAREFGISPATVKDCTMPEGGALGFFENVAIGGKACSPGRIGYIYPAGVKIREPWGRGAWANGEPKPRFLWAFGRATEPWRYSVAAWRSWITRFLITEGESDALALIEAGLSKFFPMETARSAVVASPGTSFPAEWAHLFTGRDVELWFDQDKAGRAGAERAASILYPHARSVRILRQWQP